MVERTMEISKDVYDRAVKNNGLVTADDKLEIFDPAILMGYGVYSASVFSEHGKYWCRYYRGVSCD